MNHQDQESLQNNFKVFFESLRIIENCPKIISEWFPNHQESPNRAQINFRVVYEYPRVTEDFPQKIQCGSQFTENCFHIH